MRFEILLFEEFFS